MNRLYRSATNLFALFGLFVIMYLLASVALFKKVQHVLLCDSDRTSCTMTRATFSYDSGDGHYVMSNINLDGSIRVFNGTECWVKPGGSQCMHSSDKKNDSGFDKVIVPLALELKAFRWE